MGTKRLHVIDRIQRDRRLLLQDLKAAMQTLLGQELFDELDDTVQTLFSNAAA
jgi:hypothetical protein